MRKLALFDIDGVLADDRHRVHYALNREWADYFRPDRVASDGVWPEGVQMVNDMLADGWEAGYLTGRREDLRAVTEPWLGAGGFPEAHVGMRPFEEKRVLAEFKVAYILDLIQTGEYDRICLFDDDPEVIRLVHERVGKMYAQHCTWHIKEKALVRKATS